MGTATTRVKEEANFSFQNEEENNSATLHLSAAINRMLYLNFKKKPLWQTKLGNIYFSPSYFRIFIYAMANYRIVMWIIGLMWSC